MTMMKKWTWQKKRKKDETLTEALKTSGFFNAGLTPCSHTTTTKDVIEYSPPGEYLNNTMQSWKFTINYLSDKMKTSTNNNKN